MATGKVYVVKDVDNGVWKISANTIVQTTTKQAAAWLADGTAVAYKTKEERRKDEEEAKAKGLQKEETETTQKEETETTQKEETETTQKEETETTQKDRKGKKAKG